MALVSEQEKRVCPVGSNRTWLMIFVTIEIIYSVVVLGVRIAFILAMEHIVGQTKLQGPVASARSLALGVAICLAIFSCLTMCAAFFAISAECTKRPGFLIPWFILIILGVVCDISIGVQCLVTSDFSSFAVKLIHLIILGIVIVITKRRYEELQRDSVV